MGRVDPQGLRGSGTRHPDLPIQIVSTRSGQSQNTHQGDRADTHALRIPARARHARSGGLGGEHQAHLRLYRELGLQLRNKTPKRRVKAKLRDDRRDATRPNETWAMDFVHDQLATGRKIRVLTVVDTLSRYAPVIDPRFSYRGEDVVQVLDKVCARIGYPATIRVDQGTEFVSRDLDLWAYTRGVVLDFSRPGKPTDNAFIEAFNGRFRAECLNAHWFMSLEEARQKVEAWRRYYNEERPHGAIGQKAPIMLLARDGTPSSPS